MKNLSLLLIATVSLSAQCFADSVPTSVESLSNKIETNGMSQKDAKTIEQFCELLRPANTNINFGKKYSEFGCFKTSNGLVELRAKNSLGSLSIFANPQDLVVVTNDTGGELGLKYVNNLKQSLYLDLNWVNTGSPTRYYDGAKLIGVYKADLTLRSSNSEIRIGEIREYNGQNVYP